MEDNEEPQEASVVIPSDRCVLMVLQVAMTPVALVTSSCIASRQLVHLGGDKNPEFLPGTTDQRTKSRWWASLP